MLAFDAMVKRFLLPLILIATAAVAQDPASKPKESQNATAQDGRRIHREQIPGQSAAEFDMARMRLNELGYFTVDPTDVKIQPKVSCSVPLLRIDGDKNAKIQRSTPRNVDPKILIPPQPACAERKSEPVKENRIILLPENEK